MTANVKQRKMLVKLLVLKFFVSSMSQQQQHLLTVWRKQKIKRFLFMTLAAVHLTYPSLNLAMASSKLKQQAATTSLGGDDFDQVVIDYLVAEFKKEQGIDLTKDKAAVQRLKDAAEKAKKELSGVLTTTISLPFITVVDGVPQHLEIEPDSCEIRRIDCCSC